MTEGPMIEIGDRVRLEPHPHWLCEWYPLAETGRLGTVTALPDDAVVEITFDTKRPGVRIKVGTFARYNVILVAKGPYEPPAPPAELPFMGGTLDEQEK